MMMLDSIVLYWWSIIYQWWCCGSNLIYVIGFTLLKEVKYYCRFELYEGRWSIIESILIIESCHMHVMNHLHFWSCVVILWSDRTGTHLASYVARGGVRCGFIPSEVWRQKLHALHSYAFIEVIIQPYVVVREEMVFDIWMFEFSILKY